MDDAFAESECQVVDLSSRCEWSSKKSIAYIIPLTNSGSCSATYKVQAPSKY